VEVVGQRYIGDENPFNDAPAEAPPEAAESWPSTGVEPPSLLSCPLEPLSSTLPQREPPVLQGGEPLRGEPWSLQPLTSMAADGLAVDFDAQMQDLDHLVGKIKKEALQRREAWKRCMELRSKIEQAEDKAIAETEDVLEPADRLRLEPLMSNIAQLSAPRPRPDRDAKPGQERGLTKLTKVWGVPSAPRAARDDPSSQSLGLLDTGCGARSRH